MKTLLTIISLGILCGCASQPVGPRPVYGARPAPPADPGQWRVVSVTPVAPGTGAQLAAAAGKGAVTNGSLPYVSQPDASQPDTLQPYPTKSATTIYVSPPVYYPQPIYVPQPAYVPAPYPYSYPYSYYPPVSIGLDFGFGRSWGGRGRNWGGLGIGTRWPR